MTRTIPILTIAVAVAMLASPANALHCNGDITTLETPTGTFYIDDRTTLDGDRAFAVYQETNGEAGLQSGYMHPLECIHGDPLYRVCQATEDRCDHRNADLLLV